MNSLLDEIVALSREYGASSDWVLGGGGNTSIKDEQWMWVKASGSALGSIVPEQFVKMDRRKLNGIWDTEYPEDREAREARAKQDLFDARAPGEEEKRPSVEALMHALFPRRIVYHTHPTIVNAVSCARDGERAAREIFADELLWIPMINPGYVLARRIFDERDRFLAATGREPRFIVLQNHGLVVHGAGGDDIRREHGELVSRIREAAGGLPPKPEPTAPPEPLRTAAVRLAAEVPELSASPRADALFDRFLLDQEALAPLNGALSPDHIVYAGHRPAWAETPDEVEAAVAAYQDVEGAPPKVIAVRGHGIIGVGTTAAAAENACNLFVDAARIAHLAPAFGGMQFMPADQIEFIRNWEVEKFRQQVSNRR